MDMQVPNLQAMAKHELDLANGIVTTACEALVARIIAEPRAYRMLMDPLVRNACYDLLRAICRQRRRSIWESYQPSIESGRQRIIARAEGIKDTWYEFQLEGGMYLKDARKADLAHTREVWQKRATTMHINSKWLGYIEAKLPDDKKRVADVVSLATLTQLRKKAETNA